MSDEQRFTVLTELLGQAAHQPLMHQFLVGLERETLRVTPSGQIAQTNHPVSLGSALTHPGVTTDFAESQLELVTQTPLPQVSTLLKEMNCIHAIVAQRLNDEYFWPLSMPVAIHDKDSIRLAQFGPSHAGHLKEVYRQGLVQRYGKKMQIISGIHFNHSFSQEFWQCLYAVLPSELALTDFISENYFHLSRNYLRWCWLITYLFGHTPVVDRSFLDQQPESLKILDNETLYGPYATSLRMSNFGYANSSRCQSYVSYNSQQDYLRDLLRVLTETCSDTTKIGLKDNGRYLQLYDSILQIENELYTFIRLKQPVKSGERPYTSVQKRGVAYVEVRGVDLNPYEPIGIDLTQLEFLRVFVLYCLLADSRSFTREEELINTANQGLVALRGRDPHLKLQRGPEEISLKSWADEIFDDLKLVAELMDGARPHPFYTPLVEKQYQKVLDSNQTPSALLVETLRQKQESHQDFGLRLAQEYNQYFKAYALSESFITDFEQSVQLSFEKKKELEQQSTSSFDEYLKAHREKLFA